MSDERVAQLVPGATDAEKAEEYRNRMRGALGPVLGIINEARREGLTIGFAIGINAFGQSVVQSLDVSKPL